MDRKAVNITIVIPVTTGVFAVGKPRPTAGGHEVRGRNGGRHEHVEPAVAGHGVHVHGRGDRHGGHQTEVGADSGPEGAERRSRKIRGAEPGPGAVAVPMGRDRQRRVHRRPRGKNLVAGQPEPLAAQPCRAEEPPAEPLRRLQTVDSAQEDQDGATGRLRRARHIRVGVRFHQVRRGIILFLLLLSPLYTPKTFYHHLLSLYFLLHFLRIIFNTLKIFYNINLENIT